MSAPIQTIGGRRFSFGKMSATNAVRVHVALLRVLGEPLFKLLVLGQKPKAAPVHLPNQHAESGTEPPPLPEGDAPKADEQPGAVDVMGVSLTGDDIAVIAGAVGLMMSRMEADEAIATIGLVLSSVNCEARPIADIDVTFGDGRSMEMYRVFWEALKVNFAGFFPASLFASLAAAKAK